MSSQKAFTLAELLLALVILGVIATFTIPKVLSTQADSKKKAVFRETLSAIHVVITEGWQKKDVTPATLSTYMFEHLNAIKQCTDPLAQGCWPGGGSNPGSDGVLLSNGAMFIWTDNCCDNGGGNWGTANSWVDWNGAAGPNINGDDRVRLVLSYGTAPYTNGCLPIPVRAGTIAPHCNASDSAPYQELYQDIFK